MLFPLFACDWQLYFFYRWHWYWGFYQLCYFTCRTCADYIRNVRKWLLMEIEIMVLLDFVKTNWIFVMLQLNFRIHLWSGLSVYGMKGRSWLVNAEQVDALLFFSWIVMDVLLFFHSEVWTEFLQTCSQQLCNSKLNWNCRRAVM